MANLELWQVQAIEAFVEVCERDEQGITGPWFGQELDRLAEKIRAKAPWGDLLTPWDIAGIANRRLSLKTAKLPGDYIGLLKDAPEGARLASELKTDLVEYFESLPRPYHVFFPLANVPAIGQAELALTDAIAIIDTSVNDGPHARLVQESRELKQLFNIAYGMPWARLERDTRYLRIQLSGYADNSLTSSVAVAASSLSLSRRLGGAM